MKNILVLFSSVDGQTLKICNYIKDLLADEGFNIQVASIDSHHKINTNYDFILIGASIRYGGYRHSLYKFIQNNLYELEMVKTGFFSVSAIARKIGRDIPETDHYFEKFKRKSDWTPCIAGIFAGSISYPKYNFFDRFMIQAIMYLTNGPTDSSKVFEFTDWSKVRLFATQISYILKQ
ncbi:menaquinone-dependent protoporphyrinogen IX dehydrogenase [Acinetobacter rongchengensis]|uniref:Protoporphyrinogen IX dehydrogenase [quinone] n=1 Tax=Acinetobacter rongchengensis TaxID=2419601 RepID=A0A3A8EWM1_9GAMM|nr:menaquinone-dependent protoporphyrinogen IX dehydrogenase [Acinetobacter rongchengensis]RKG38549.1 menaquinone-dependent protoporphyrinogen IX dehydrogenase [Acinetobacter rongchengensis]